MNSQKIFWYSQTLEDVPMAMNWLAPSELEVLKGYKFPKKQNDYLLGRWTTKMAIQAFLAKSYPGLILSEIEVRKAKDGAPEAYSGNNPLPIYISLSHSHGNGLCSISSAEIIHGCDIEYIEPRSEAFISDYLTRNERNLLAEYTDKNKPLIANLIWSAKEATMKLLRTGLSIDTRTVAVQSVDHKNMKTWNSLKVIHNSSQEKYFGLWTIKEKFIYIIISMYPDTQLLGLA